MYGYERSDGLGYSLHADAPLDAAKARPVLTLLAQLLAVVG